LPVPAGYKNKANSKPKQSQTKPIRKMAKMKVSALTTMYYGKKSAFCQNGNKAKTNPILVSPRIYPGVGRALAADAAFTSAAIFINFGRV